MTRQPSNIPAPSTLVLLALLATALFAIRVTGPSDLMDNDQLKPAHYVHDAVLNGNWIVQRDVSGDIASKPPLQVWLAALVSIPLGRAHWFTLALPSLVGVCMTAYASAWFAGRLRPRDSLAPLVAGMLVLVSMMGTKQVALVRTDALFGGLIALTAMYGYRASRSECSWVFFWIGAALATLTKGPLGLLVPALGLVARPWRDPGGRRGSIRAHAAGAMCYILLAGGWFALAWMTAGEPFIEKVIGRELVGHAVESGKGAPPVVHAYKTWGYYLWWYAPAAPLALLALLMRDRWLPAPDGDTGEASEHTRLVRTLAWWMLGGVVLFSLFPHQRADLLTPVWAPTAAIASCALLHALGAACRTRLRVALALAGVGLCVLTAYHRHVVVEGSWYVRNARAIEALADRQPPATTRAYTGHSYFDYVQGKMDLRLTDEEAREWLRSAPDARITVNTNAKPPFPTRVVDRVREGGFVLELHAAP